jgi:hypothetical protein
VGFEPSFVGGDFFEDSLGGLVVIPEPLFAGTLFEDGYLAFEAVEVKDTSLTCRGDPEVRESGCEFLQFARLSVL